MNYYFWLIVMPNLGQFFGAFGILGITSCIISVLIYLYKCSDLDDKKAQEDAKKYGKFIFKQFAMSMTFLFITCFIPEKKDIIMLKSLSIISDLKGSEKIPQLLIDKLNNLLQEHKD